jgi:hypothetical protein
MKKVTLLMAFLIIACVSYAQKLEFKLRPIVVSTDLMLACTSMASKAK